MKHQIKFDEIFESNTNFALNHLYLDRCTQARQIYLLKDSTPVGGMPLAWKSYVLQFPLPPPDVSLGGRSPNEKIWTGLQWSLAGGVSHKFWYRGGALPSDLSHDAFDVTYPPEQNDRHLWKHYLPATSFAGGNNLIGKTLYISHETSLAMSDSVITNFGWWVGHTII